MMSRRSLVAAVSTLPWITLAGCAETAARPRKAPAVRRRKTAVSIVGDAFHINGKPTYAGRTFEGRKIEGLLMNSRMVNGIFDDENAETRKMWAYPDGPYDADRNTSEFIAAMAEWRRHGMLGFTISLQGGSPQGYTIPVAGRPRGAPNPWVNSAFDFATGGLKPAYMARLERIIDAADQLGMVAIVSLFYQGQASRFPGEASVLAATDAATDWLASGTGLYERARRDRERVRSARLPATRPATAGPRSDFPRATTQRGESGLPRRTFADKHQLWRRAIPGENVAAVADYLLLHGNGISQPAQIADMIAHTRALKAFDGQPIMINEDDHFDFDKPVNNMLAAIGSYVSWGLFDYRLRNETDYNEGYQSVPVNWGISSARKRGFFDLLAKVTGN